MADPKARKPATDPTVNGLHGFSAGEPREPNATPDEHVTQAQAVGTHRIETLEIDKIVRDRDVQPRCEDVSDDVVGEYAEDMQAGEVFPPVEVVRDDSGVCWLWDGFHRIAAAITNGQTTIACRITPGDRRMAILLSTQANARHGERRTDLDKTFVVQKLLNDPEGSKWSAREIARQAHVSHVFVSKLRSEHAAEAAVTGNVSSEAGTVRYRNKYGQITTMRPATTRAKNRNPGNPELHQLLKNVVTGQPVEEERITPTSSLFGDADKKQLDGLIDQAFRAECANLIDPSLADWLEEAGEKLINLAGRLRR